jgi:acyl-CoA oxidase
MAQSKQSLTSTVPAASPLSASSTPLHSFWERLLRLGQRKHAPASTSPTCDDDTEETSGVHRRLDAPPFLDRAPFRGADLTQWLYQLSPELLAFREEVKAVLREPEFETPEGLTSTERAQLSYSRFKRLRDALDLRVRDVEERPARLAAALEMVGTVDGTLFTVMSIHYCLCAGSLLRHGSGSPATARYLEELDSLETIGTFLVTELGFGNNVVALQTRADYDTESGELVVNTPSAEARKFMPNTGVPGVPKLGVVMARLFVKDVDHGVVPVVMRLRTKEGPCPGVSISPLGDKPSYALDNAMTSFHDVRLPKHSLLLGDHSQLNDDGTFKSSMRSRRERFLLSMEQVQLGRLCLSALAATATGVSAFIAIKYAEQRRTFAPRHADVPVLDYQNHQRDVFTALSYAYASRLMVNSAVHEYESSGEGDHDYSFRITSATKAHTTYSFERFVGICRERCGAVGLFEENRLSVYAAQCQGMVTAEGDNHIVLIKIARQMLLGQGYTKLGKARFDSSAALSDPERLLGLMCERERRLLAELRRAMAPSMLPGQDLFKIWNENINLAIETATAHTSRLVAEAYWKRIKVLTGKGPLLDLFKLYVLQEIAPHLGFFLAEELITREEVRRHGKVLDGLCAELRPFALELAAAFDVPNSLLRTAIASENYVAHYDARARRQEAEAARDSQELSFGADSAVLTITGAVARQASA